MESRNLATLPYDLIFILLTFQDFETLGPLIRTSRSFYASFQAFKCLIITEIGHRTIGRYAWKRAAMIAWYQRAGNKAPLGTDANPNKIISKEYEAYFERPQPRTEDILHLFYHKCHVDECLNYTKYNMASELGFLERFVAMPPRPPLVRFLGYSPSEKRRIYRAIYNAWLLSYKYEYERRLVGLRALSVGMENISVRERLEVGIFCRIEGIARSMHSYGLFSDKARVKNRPTFDPWTTHFRGLVARYLFAVGKGETGTKKKERLDRIWPRLRNVLLFLDPYQQEMDELETLYIEWPLEP